jgi:hypothetical protein
MVPWTWQCSGTLVVAGFNTAELISDCRGSAAKYE